MKTKTLITTMVAFAISGAVFAQSWEQKYQQADTELNRVYKELRSNLNELEKAELKKIQLAWLKDKERSVQSVDSTNEKLRIATSLTIQRTAELRSGFSDSASNAGNSAGMPMLSDSEASKLLVGKWAFHNGSKYSTTYVFKSDKSFTEVTEAPRYGTYNRYIGSWRIENSRLVLNKKGEQEPSIIEIKFNNRNSFALDWEVFDREN